MLGRQIYSLELFLFKSRENPNCSSREALSELLSEIKSEVKDALHEHIHHRATLECV